jgi:selenocysteine lyase/cysteine desulfurase
MRSSLIAAPPSADVWPSLAEAEASFHVRFPTFLATRHLDELRARDYGRLDALGQTYLDFTGGGLYAEAQLRAHLELLQRSVLGNPHSTNPTSLATTRLVERARTAILAYFRAAPEEYLVIFTPNASGALKLVGEAYPFGPGAQYLLTVDNHNSVNGIREFARARGATVTYTPVLPPDLRLDAGTLLTQLERARPGGQHLFAYPAQSNFSGVQHPLEWIAQAQARGWEVLLDAAAFVPTNRLDLSQWHPDFVALSFYKLFGYPTGVGCLLAHREALRRLRRPWFAGGTIEVVSVRGDRSYMHEGAEAFEDGTLNYLALPAVEIGLRYLEGIGIELIHTRVQTLTAWLLETLAACRHDNGAQVVQVYGPLSTEERGATLALNFYDRDGHFIDHRLIEREATAAGISVRTGCFCNPGEGEVALGLATDELRACFVRHPERLTLDEFRRCLDDQSTGAVRISLGLVTTFADVYRFATFARRYRDIRTVDLGAVD